MESPALRHLQTTTHPALYDKKSWHEDTTVYLVVALIVLDNLIFSSAATCCNNNGLFIISSHDPGKMIPV